MATLTPEECTRLHSKVCKLQPMHMEMFQQKLKLMDEDYPFTLPGWLQLTLQIGSGLTLLTVGIALVWFCIRHRSHLAALWKFSSTLVPKLKEYPDLFPQLLSVGTNFLTQQHPLHHLHVQDHRVIYSLRSPLWMWDPLQLLLKSPIKNLLSTTSSIYTAPQHPGVHYSSCAGTLFPREVENQVIFSSLEEGTKARPY